MQVLTDTVEYDDGRVDRVTYDRQHTRDESAANRNSDQSVSRKNDKAVMRKADDRGSAEACILETEPDVDQHQDQRYDDRVERRVLHLGPGS